MFVDAEHSFGVCERFYAFWGSIVYILYGYGASNFAHFTKKTNNAEKGLLLLFFLAKIANVTRVLYGSVHSQLGFANQNRRKNK